MSEPEIFLTKAGADDVTRAAEVIVDTAEGLLEYAFEPVRLILGVSSVAELMAMALMQGDSAFSLENVTIIKAAESSSEPFAAAGLCLAYPAANNAQLLPEAAGHYINPQAVTLLGKILPVPPEGCRELYLNTLWISPKWRQLHLGMLLLEHLKAQALGLGCSSIVLHCFNDNRAALNFYHSQGFKRTAEIEYPQDLSERHPSGGSLLRLDLQNSFAGGDDA